MKVTRMSASRICSSVMTCLLLLSVTAEAFARSRPVDVMVDLQKSVPRYMRQYSVPGAAIALIREGKVIWMQGFGLADVASGRAVDADTVFNVGSISKTVTAWGAWPGALVSIRSGKPAALFSSASPWASVNDVVRSCVFVDSALAVTWAATTGQS